VDNHSQLQALTEAYKILKEAANQCAGYAADKPYQFVSDSRNYIARQADELLSPIFDKETA
jgi:hypothetical protein